MEFAIPRVGHHAVELHPLFCRGSGDTLIGVDLKECPLWILENVPAKKRLLGFKGVELILVIGGYSAVTGNLNWIHADAAGVLLPAAAVYP
jgi:hypothetical protein